MSGAGYDFSDRGVEGRPTPGPIDIFLYNERGIYRAGEDVHSVALMRDDSAAAVENVPLTFIYKRPDGVEAKRVSSTAANLGGHAVTYGLADNAMRGTWTLQVFLDPDDSPIGEKKFLVEDFVPDRIEFDLTSVDKEILPRQNARIELSGRYLYGAPANGLSLEGEVRVRTIRENESHSGFWFGLEDEEDNGSQVYPLAELPLTDAAGKAVILAGVGELPATTRPMMADIVVRMQELGGRAVERKLELPVVSAGPMIGVRPEFDLDGLSENSVAEFSIIAIDQESKRVDLAGLNWSLHKLERNYQWYRQGGNWRYESVTIPTQVGDGEISASAADLVKISAPVKWGQYRLDVESADPNGPATSIEFSAGWVVQAGSAETPDALEIALDRNKYSVGDVARLSVSPRFAGEMFVTIGANQTREILTASVPSEGLTLNIPVKKEWGAGVYVTATLIRPGSAKASRLPTRAIGTSWLQVDPGPRKLEINMALAEKIRPDQKLSIPISVGGLKAGDKAFVTVAAVDVGILNLTRYEPPEPSDWFHGQRALGLEVRDMYGRLIDGSLGTLGRLRTGGDAPGLAAEGSPPTQELLALFSGVVKLDDNGQATIEFDLPKFNGTARVMAVAWSSNGVGSAHSDIIIRDPVVVTASLPKVMAPGDLTQAIIEISNTDGPAGSYSISISSNDVIAVDGDVAQTIELSVGERKSVIVPVRANFPGSAELFVTASHESGTEVSVAHLVTVRPATLPITSRSVFAIAGNGGNFNINKDLLTGNILDGAKIAVSVSSSAAFDLPGLLMKLDTYPYGCAEQTTSRALPLLYMSELGVSPLFLKPDEITKRVNGAIKRVLSYQSSSGSFGLWSPGYGDLWLDSYVSDFLTRAREKGFSVPPLGLKLALGNLQNSVGYNNDISDNSGEIAYALYVLARNRMASAGDLRYFADTKLAEFKTSLARAQLAAALSLYNDVERANKVFGSAFRLAKDRLGVHLARADYGSALRDDAAMLALASEVRPVSPLVPQMAELVAQELENKKYTSTQENAWMMLAARAVQKSNRTIELTVNGEKSKGAYSVNLEGRSLVDTPLTVVNQSDRKLSAVVTTVASPEQPLSAGGNGFEIKRSYFRLDGSPAQLNDVRQNERFVVVLNVSELNNWTSRIVITDLLAGGFEIDNPRLVGSAELSEFKWLGDIDVAHTEFRDDRFVAAFERHSSSKRNFNVAYVARAVSIGEFTLPAASVEDMYRPQFQARTATGFIQIKPAQ